ncbi:alpha/beta fold hydrolase [Hyphococcus luteus]|uniref:Alpha/beta hydrolase n=1 Tax=Hyphococcus luteus TaxID=2058213 RepID=A0A2S7K5Q9_9PROT|nr:alpha/beta hydrolase [Marinicaulis flavus]PQA87811.1 alpha/beta hydrolase [Marinicaulis flavus]
MTSGTGPAPQRIRIELNDGALAGFRWPAPDRPPLLFLHATGFCACVYRRMLGGLKDRFDIYALDLRGHGLNTRPADPSRLRSWKPFVADARAFLDRERREGWTLAGHSMGAATSVLVAQGRTDVAALKLIEPVAMPGWMTFAAKTPFWPLMSNRIPLVRQAARRRNRWPDRESVLASYARKGLFKAWAPGVLEDYLEDGLVDDASGEGVRLSCDPRWESATFAAQANDVWAAARAAPAKMSVFAADHPSSTVSSAARARFRRLGAELVVRPGVSHLAPMEKPQDLAAFLGA